MRFGAELEDIFDQWEWPRAAGGGCGGWSWEVGLGYTTIRRRLKWQCKAAQPYEEDEN